MKPDPKDCAYCPDPGADVCVKLTARPSGPPHAVFAHEQCGRDRGLAPLYRLVNTVPQQPDVVPWLGVEHFG